MLKYLIRKEFLHISRDRRLLPIIFIAPIIQLIILGYAANFDVKDIPTVVYDLDKTPESREYLSSYFSSGYFEKVAQLNDYKKIDSYLDTGKASACIVIPSGFGKNISEGESTSVQTIINGTDSILGSSGLNYINNINSTYSANILEQRIAQIKNLKISILDVEDRVWYNPELKSRNYMIPAILSLILMITTTMLTSMAIVREKEVGTIEQLVVTPVKKHQIILGKLIPFVVIGLADVVLIIAVGTLWFGVPLKGSILLLFFASLLFLLNTLGLGLLVSTLSQTQQQAMMTAMFFFMFPFIYLSGFVFPIENMPKPVQYVTYAIPLRYFLVIVRGIFLKGVGIATLWPHMSALAFIGVMILIISTTRFRKSL